MAEHTPTPWTSKRSAFPVDGEYDYGISAVLMDGKPYCIAEAVGRCSDNFTLNAQANAAFIVKACNSHDALVKALEEVAYPIKAMESRLNPDEKIDGVMTVALANNAEYLRSIALKALAALQEAGR